MVDDQHVEQVERVRTPAQQMRDIAGKNSRKKRVFAHQSQVQQSDGHRDQEIVDEVDRVRIQRHTAINEAHGDGQQQNAGQSGRRRPAALNAERSTFFDFSHDERKVEAGEEFAEVTEESRRHHELRRFQEHDPLLRNRQGHQKQGPAHGESQKEAVAPGEKHEKRRQEIKALLYRQRPTRLNDELRPMKERVRQRVIGHQRPRPNIGLQVERHSQQQPINRINTSKAVYGILREPPALDRRLRIINANDQKPAEHEEKRHDVDRDVRVVPGRKMIEKNNGSADRPHARQGGVTFAPELQATQIGHAMASSGRQAVTASL
ncbi:MAG: hypothetical protein JWN43_560 [Gammaproteobacteria bacterium]|nr:hypothetical protein [Gammaproteobacteria bacterium]